MISIAIWSSQCKCKLLIINYLLQKRSNTNTTYIRSPIPEGGLEVPVEVTFTYEDDEKLSKIKSLIMENYDGFDKIKEVECDDNDDECQVNLTT